MPTLYNPGKKKGIFFIPSGATVSPITPTPSFSSTKSIEFDGVDDYIDLGTSSTLELIDNFTISFWINTTTVRNSGIIVCGDYAGSLGWKFRTASGKVGFVVGSKTIHSTTNINDASWYHVCATFNATNPSSGGREHILYINGVAETTSQYGSATNPSYSGTIYKQIVYPGGQYFEGGIDEVSAFDYTLLPSDITTLYNSGTPTDLTSESGLVSWYRMGENSTFSSQILMPENTNKDKVSNYSMEFDGIDDYVDCGNSTLSGETALSISAWVYPTAYGSAVAESMVSTELSSPNRGFYLSLFNSTNFRWQVSTDGTLKDSLDTVGGTVTLNTWQHILVTWTQTTMNFYINGVLSKTQATSAATGTFTTANDILIGMRTPTPAGPFPGKIDEVAIFDTDQSANAATIWNDGVPNDLTSLSPLVYLKMGEEAIFNSSNWLLPNKAQDVYSRYSMQFDGIDDCVNPGTTSAATDTSISFWINSPLDGLISNIVSGPVGLFQYFGKLGAGNANIYINHWTVGWVAIVTDVFDDTWHHIVVTLDNSTGEIKSYKDGVLNTTVTVTALIGLSTDIQTIGCYKTGTSRFLEGMLDEVSLYNTTLDQTAVTGLWNLGAPGDITGTSGLTNWWRMGEDATFSTTWTIPDKTGSNNGAGSANMLENSLVGEAPGSSGNGISDNMDINDRTGDAPDSSNNALSYNMDAADIEEETP